MFLLTTQSNLDLYIEVDCAVNDISFKRKIATL